MFEEGRSGIGFKEQGICKASEGFARNGLRIGVEAVSDKGRDALASIG
jgi:hypothetical protein